MVCDNVYYTYNLYYGRTKYCSEGYDYYDNGCCSYGWSEFGWWLLWISLFFIILSCICAGIRKRNQRRAMMMA